MKEIEKQFKEDINKVGNLNLLQEVRNKYISKKGLITQLNEKLKKINISEKKEFGKKLNELKEKFNILYQQKEQGLKDELIKEKLVADKIDITIPGIKIKVGSPHVLEKLIEELEELFIAMGYDVIEGPEVELDLYNFEMLNLPKGHPARDMQDSFYIDNENLLRSHTSPVQIREMLKNKEKTPLRILCPGKVYRRDTDDATHSHQFMQMEGLLVDKKVSLAELKGTFEIIVKNIFGKDIESRFRPDFYPFTEPSVAMDISCFVCQKEGCSVCKHSGWITIGGAGMVHPNVLKMSGYDNEKYTGFAFGFGIDRLAMIKYGITDVRQIYNNDMRINRQFEKRGALNED